MLSWEFVASLGDSESPRLRRVIYNLVRYITSWCWSRNQTVTESTARGSPYIFADGMQIGKVHHRCQYTSWEESQTQTHTLVCRVRLFYLFKYLGLVVMWRACMCTYKCLRAVSGKALQIYEVHCDVHICIINLNYAALFVYSLEQMEIS